jgi:2-oxoglutarate dehydrogenase E1 component
MPHFGPARADPWRCRFAGQGVVAECFAMSGIKGFRTGGTVHFVINNQIGFTTAPIFSALPLLHRHRADGAGADLPRERRRSEAVVHATRIAVEFRQKFKKDVVLDMICYRRFGHNETDEPSFTQPHMYR